MIEKVYEEEYFIGDCSPILFGYTSIFYRVNAWFRFRKITSLITKYGGRGRVLDIGCALGHSVDRFSLVGFDSFGCDVSSWATKKAKKMNPNVNIIRANALSLPFKSKTFNITTALETLEHCSDLKTVLNEIKRVTKSEGLVIVSVPTTDLNNTCEDRTHVWHMSLRQWTRLFSNYFRVLSVSFFMKFMKYIDGKTCNTFIILRNEKNV